MIAHTTVQHVTRVEDKNPEIQQIIRNCHMTLDYAIGPEEFMSDLDGMDAFINKGFTSQEEEYV